MNQILVCELGEFTVSRVAVMIKKKFIRHLNKTWQIISTQ